MGDDSISERDRDERVAQTAGSEVERAIERLQAAARAHRAAVGELMRLGVVRSRTLVGDLGEALAARFYGVDLAPASTPGYDLVTREGARVQVKTLRTTPGNWRTSMGVMGRPYDLVLAIRLDEDYRPLEAIEVPREVLEERYGSGRVSWTQQLASDPRVRRIAMDELAGGAGL